MGAGVITLYYIRQKQIRDFNNNIGSPEVVTVDSINKATGTYSICGELALPKDSNSLFWLQERFPEGTIYVFKGETSILSNTNNTGGKQLCYADINKALSNQKLGKYTVPELDSNFTSLTILQNHLNFVDEDPNWSSKKYIVFYSWCLYDKNSYLENQIPCKVLNDSVLYININLDYNQDIWPEEKPI